jgi:hypothetical protein
MASPTPPALTSSEPIAPAAAATTTTTTEKPSQKDAPPEKIKGLKLAILLGSITLMTFLGLLDTSIVGTVTTLPTPHLPHSNL